MTDPSSFSGAKTEQSEWTGYMDAMKRHVAKQRRKRKLTLTCLFCCLMVAFGYFGSEETASKLPPQGADAAQNVRKRQPAKAREAALGQRELQAMMRKHPIVNSTEPDFRISHLNQTFLVETSLDPRLQQIGSKNLYTKTSRYIGIVVMEPATGRILAMVGYDKTRPGSNPCIQSDYPAASVFKIITTAAALEQHELNAASTLSFSGKKHTLYQSQINPRAAAQKTSLREAFAQSINPVFGKIGALNLGKPPLDQFARAFGFNRSIDFDMPLEPSPCRITSEPFHLAQIASGYNRTTRMSPVHGALIASAILNGGRMPEPSLVDQVKDSFGNSVYRHRTETIGQVISPRSAAILRDIMGATIDAGTGRRSFAGYQKDPVLARLEIGGKTGSMDNDTHDVHFDWFVGFGSDHHSGKTIAVSALVGHEQFKGIRAGQYARMMIREYFGRGQQAPAHAPAKPVLTKKIKAKPRNG
ncbi:penicillin-binding transpeptidase domain-containing protein [Desulfatirhabdium butyrativorans]|uniref:penicillin-binding transpeptidase domain-containing protein n=1 Tax=Desulfatirhabdium butyrativorans TaxID=340467 RepID=UPI000687F601|nr:penicillin-binding transpeptidase domain-containing protein [Desulfatirhabdium butyrativorans]